MVWLKQEAFVLRWGYGFGERPSWRGKWKRGSELVDSDDGVEEFLVVV